MDFKTIKGTRYSGTALLLFLIGVFSQTQIRIVGKIGLSELCMVLAAPLVLSSNWQRIKQGGLMPIVTLAFLWVVGAVISDLCNHTYFQFAMKGVAVPIVVLSSIVCIYSLLSRDLRNLRWLLLGIAISVVLSTFVLQRGRAGDYAADTGDIALAAESVMSYKLYWVTMSIAWLSLPITGWYQKVPIFYSVLASFGLAVLSLKVGGRSLFAVNLLSCILILYARKNVGRMMAIRKHVFLFLLGLFALAVVMKQIYSYAAKNGYMGDYELRKYRIQTEHGSSFAHLLISGRTDFFIGLRAALDKPIIGQGSHAIDTQGYMVDIVSKYGDLGEVERASKAILTGMVNIKAHSHVITYWMWHGIFGLLFWGYVIWTVAGTLFKRMGFFPPYYGYLAMTIPAFMWDVFFSPLSLRVNACVLMVVCVIVKKVAENTKRGFSGLIP